MSERAGPSDLDRVVFFSDAVFAIAITLLVVELGVPDVPEAELGSALADLWPKVLAFFLSFAVIGLYWLAHRRTFRQLRGVDGKLLVVNLVFLALIAFQPFPTAVLGSYGSATAAVVLYAGSLALTGFALTGLWAYARRAQLIVVDDVRARRILARSMGRRSCSRPRSRSPCSPRRLQSRRGSRFSVVSGLDPQRADGEEPE